MSLLFDSIKMIVNMEVLPRWCKDGTYQWTICLAIVQWCFEACFAPILEIIDKNGGVKSYSILVSVKSLFQYRRPQCQTIPVLHLLIWDSFRSKEAIRPATVKSSYREPSTICRYYSKCGITRFHNMSASRITFSCSAAEWVSIQPFFGADGISDYEHSDISSVWFPQSHVYETTGTSCRINCPPCTPILFTPIIPTTWISRWLSPTTRPNSYVVLGIPFVETEHLFWLM